MGDKFRRGKKGTARFIQKHGRFGKKRRDKFYGKRRDYVPSPPDDGRYDPDERYG